jgi:4-amino-4-deoxy-L-arabinose transferase-like glycosyltransferase
MGKRFRKKKRKAASFALSSSPSSIEWCYFACGPLVALGFLVAGPIGVLIALSIDGCLYCLLYFYTKRASRHR